MLYSQIVSIYFLSTALKGCFVSLAYSTVFIEKIYLGLLLAAPIGPVSLEMIKRGLTSGFWSSFSIRLGGGIANILCLVVTCFGLSQLSEFSLLINSLGFLGVFLLFYLGYSTLKQDLVLDNGNGSKKNLRNGLLLGFYLGVFNPVALAFWPGIFASSLKNIHDIGLQDLFENSFILLGILLWGAGLSFVSSWGGKLFSFSKLKLIAKLSGFLIILYGCKSLYHMLERVHFI